MDYKTQTAWKRENTRFYGIRLSKITDADLIEWVERSVGGGSVQGYLKRLICEDMEKNKRARV